MKNKQTSSQEGGTCSGLWEDICFAKGGMAKVVFNIDCIPVYLILEKSLIQLYTGECLISSLISH